VRSGGAPGCKRPRWRQVLAWLLLPGLLGPLWAAEPLDQAISLQRKADDRAVTSQKRVERLDDQTREMLEAYRQVNRQLERLRQENAHAAKQAEAQEVELRQIAEQLQGLEATRRDIEPLMRQMLQVLERFVALDTPFLPEERQGRLKQLRGLLEQEASLPESYRRLLEAYQVETEYGRTIEAYQGELPGDQAGRQVEFLRLGRLALYYLTLDGREAGIWDPKTKQWVRLEASYNPDIQRALRIARKQLPPDLMPLPLFAPGGEGPTP